MTFTLSCALWRTRSADQVGTKKQLTDREDSVTCLSTCIPKGCLRSNRYPDQIRMRAKCHAAMRCLRRLAAHRRLGAPNRVSAPKREPFRMNSVCKGGISVYLCNERFFRRLDHARSRHEAQFFTSGT